MQIYKTVDNDNFIRLEEDGGAAITLYRNSGIAIVIALMVPRSDRRDGIGAALLTGACMEARDKGHKMLEADFFSEIAGMKDLFESCGFEVEEDAPVYAIDTSGLLASEKVKKAVSQNQTGVRFASFEELMMMQWDELMDLFSHFSIRLSNNDLTHFSQSLSGVVYDKDGIARSFILCSESDNKINVDFLALSPGSNPSFLVAALQGMILELISAGGAVRYKKLTMVSANPSVKKLMDSVLNGQEPELLGYSMYAHIDLSKFEDDYNVEIIEDISEDMENEWRKELRSVPMQANISWKCSWYRNRERGEVKEDEPEAESNDTEEKAKSPKKEKAVSEEDTVIDFPLEIMDPLDIDFNFDKDLDEDEGLDSSRAKRITEDNLDEMTDILSRDAYQSVLRPYYRGLAVESEEGESYSWMVYELENMEDEEDRQAQILWMDIADDESGETLLTEFAGECKNDEAKNSRFECPEKREDISDAMKNNGFNVNTRESQDVIVTIGELQKLAFVMRKTPEYVLGLGNIGERQFKRGIGNCLLNNRRGLLQDMAFLPMEWFEQDVSSVVLTDDRVTGMLLVHQMASRKLMVDLFFSSSGDSRMDLIRMVQHSVQAASVKYPPETKVIIRRHDKAVEGIVSKIFPGRKGNQVFYGERKEAR